MTFLCACGPNSDNQPRVTSLLESLLAIEVAFSRSNYQEVSTLCNGIVDFDHTGCSLFWLGVLYLRGMNCDAPDQKQAHLYFLSALPMLEETIQSEADPCLRPLAEASLAWMHCHGLVVEWNVQRALELNRSAAGTTSFGHWLIRRARNHESTQ